MQVEFDRINNEILFYGDKLNELEQAKWTVSDILKKIKAVELDCPGLSNVIRNLKLNDTYYAGLLKANSICCVIDSRSVANKVFIYGNTVEEVTKCETLLIKAATTV